MGWRVGSAVLLAVLLAGCAENRLFSGLAGQASYAMATPAQQPENAFRFSELKAGLGKADLEAMYPGRLARSRGDARNEQYLVEAPGAVAQPQVMRERLELWLTDGKLAAYDIARTDAPLARPSVSLSTPAVTPPSGKFGVQIAARRSEAEGRALVDEMRAKYPGLLAQQWATLYRVSLPQGVFYRVVVGPLQTAEEASQLCSSLRAQGVECFTRET